MSADIWSDIADWRGPTVNEAGPMDEHRGVIEHIADGSFEGTIEWQRNPAAQVSSHFIIAKDGRIAQMVPANSHTAWTQQNGNGHWLSCENEGRSGESLTDAQVWANAKILARAHVLYGAPLQLATSPLGRGLGHHSMGTNGRNVSTDTWTGPTWGHELCPGPAIVAQKPLIIARATEIINGGATGMAGLTDSDQQALIWRVKALLDNSTVVGGTGPAAGELNGLASAIAAATAAASAPRPVTLSLSEAQVAQLIAAVPTVAQICDEMDRRQRARLAT